MNLTDEDDHASNFLSTNISPWNFFLAVLLAPLTSYFIVVFFTSVLDLISREQWPIYTVIWPPAIYFGGITGGTVGGFLAFWEIRQNSDSNNSLIEARLFTQELLYLGLLTILTYILEILSESIILQTFLFILEIAFFIVIGRNISKLTLKFSISSENSKDTEEDSEL